MQATAKAAIEAALTGHLVVSTIHAKDGVGSLFRLCKSWCIDGRVKTND